MEFSPWIDLTCCRPNSVAFFTTLWLSSTPLKINFSPTLNLPFTSYAVAIPELETSNLRCAVAPVAFPLIWIGVCSVTGAFNSNSTYGLTSYNARSQLLVSRLSLLYVPYSN